MHMHFVTCGNITFYVAETPFYVAETASDLLVRPLLHVIMCVVIQSENSLTNEAELIIRCGSN